MPTLNENGLTFDFGECSSWVNRLYAIHKQLEEDFYSGRNPTGFTVQDAGDLYGEFKSADDKWEEYERQKHDCL